MLIEEKHLGWHQGMPVICVTGMEGIESSQVVLKKDKQISHGNLNKFLDFVVFLADNKLCHVILNTSRDFTHNVLDQRNQKFRVITG